MNPSFSVKYAWRLNGKQKQEVSTLLARSGGAVSFSTTLVLLHEARPLAVLSFRQSHLLRIAQATSHAAVAFNRMHGHSPHEELLRHFVQRLPTNEFTADFLVPQSQKIAQRFEAKGLIRRKGFREGWIRRKLTEWADFRLGKPTGYKYELTPQARENLVPAISLSKKSAHTLFA